MECDNLKDKTLQSYPME